MVKKITLIRHGQPLGEEDPHLSDNGKNDCANLKGNYDLILLSPLRRCIDTYVSSKLNSNKIEFLILLREKQDGRTYNSLLCETPIAESDEIFNKRILELKNYLLNRSEENICCITSAFTICHLQMAFGLNCHPLNYLDIVNINL